jgi:hypothetical protein
VSGGEVEEPPSLLKMHDQMAPSLLEMTAYTVFSLIVIVWIIRCLYRKLKTD